MVGSVVNEPDQSEHVVISEKTHVRVIERRPDGFIEFEFSFEDPSLYVEIYLAEKEFKEFCAMHNPEFLPPRPEHATAFGSLDDEVADQWNWTMHDATHQRFKNQ